MNNPKWIGRDPRAGICDKDSKKKKKALLKVRTVQISSHVVSRTQLHDPAKGKRFTNMLDFRSNMYFITPTRGL